MAAGQAEGDVCIISQGSREEEENTAERKNGTPKPLGDCQVAEADKRP